MNERELFEKRDNQLCHAASVLEEAESKTDAVVEILEGSDDEWCEGLAEIFRTLQTQMRDFARSLKNEASQIESMLYEGGKSNDECVAS